MDISSTRHEEIEPEYEKATDVLSSIEREVVLAKVDVNKEENKLLASQYDVNGFPTLKIIRNGGKAVHDYKDSREANGTVDYLIKLSGPASTETKSSKNALEKFVEKSSVAVVTEFNTQSRHPPPVTMVSRSSGEKQWILVCT